MKILITKTHPKAGKVGEIKNVADGYALNFLIPQGFAEPASKEVLAVVDQKRKKLQKQEEREIELAKEIQKKLKGKSVSIHTKASEEGTLFAGIKAAAAIEAIKKEYKIDIKPIQLSSFPQIKKTGDYTIELALAKDISVSVQLKIVAV